MAKDECVIKVLLVGDVNVGKTSLATRYALDSFQSSAKSSSSVSGFDNYLVTGSIDNLKIPLEIIDTSEATPLPSPNSIKHHSSDSNPSVTHDQPAQPLQSQPQQKPQQKHNLLDAPPFSSDQLHSRKLAYQGCDVVLFVFSIDKPESLKAINDKYNAEVNTYCSNSSSIIKILVGTKQDIHEDQPTLHALISSGTVPVSHADAEQVCRNINAVYYCPCSSKTREGVAEVFEAVLKTAVKRGLHLTSATKKQREKKSDRSCMCLDWLKDVILNWDKQ